jgi:NADH-quinone oxidoreductase subunit K
MTTLPLSWYLLLSAALFTLGLIGMVLRRNVIVLFMCVELMLNAGNLALLAFSRYALDVQGHVMAMVVIAVAAAEAGIGLALIVNVFRHRQTVNVNELNTLSG